MGDIEAEGTEKPKEEPKEEPPGEHTVNSAPVGPPTPSSGWHLAYGDAFGKPLSEDKTLELPTNSKGCCNNSNEVAREGPSAVKIAPEGLDLQCKNESGYICGAARTDAFFEWNFATSGEWAVECYCKWPVDTGGADPGFWVYASQEIDFFEGWGWNGTSWATANAGVPVVVGQGEHEVRPVTSGLGFDPSAGFHRFVTVYNSGVFSEYIDGALRWTLNATAANTSDGFIMTNALRVNTQTNDFVIHSIAMWQDGAHAGVGIKGGGVAPGTTVK